MIDGNKDTKWCDTGMTPNYVDFDLGKQQHISGWKLINAGEESHSYVTKGCFRKERIIRMKNGRPWTGLTATVAIKWSANYPNPRRHVISAF